MATDELADLDKRLSLVEQAVNAGFSQLRLDLQRVMGEFSGRDDEQSRQVEVLDARLTVLREEFLTLRAETRLVIGIGSFIGLGVIGLIVERVAAVL